MANILISSSIYVIFWNFYLKKKNLKNALGFPVYSQMVIFYTKVGNVVRIWKVLQLKPTPTYSFS